MERKKQLERELEEDKQRKEEEEKRKRELERRERFIRETSQENERQKVAAASAIIIGNDLSNPDPVIISHKNISRNHTSFIFLFRI